DSIAQLKISFLGDCKFVSVLHDSNLANSNINVTQTVILSDILIKDLNLESLDIPWHEEMEDFFPDWRRVVVNGLGPQLVRMEMLLLRILREVNLGIRITLVDQSRLQALCAVQIDFQKGK